MEGWNPFGKIDIEIGSFLKASPFNKQYKQKEKETDAHDKTHNGNATNR